MQKSYLIIDCKLVTINQAIDLALKFVSELSSRANPRDLRKVRTRLTAEKAHDRQGDLGMIIVLNVAGPRSTQWPQGQEIARQIVSAILRRFSGQKDAN